MTWGSLRWTLLALLLLPLVLAAYEESVAEGIYLVRPENTYIEETTLPTYLSSEDLTFFACIEVDDTPVRLSLLCEDDNNFVDVHATQWGTENCWIGSVDLDDFPCYDALIAADYVQDGENLRLTKQVRINKVTGALQRMLDTQFADGGWSSSLDTAFALFALKPFSEVFDDAVEQGLLYLKESRDDQYKCWPSGQCQISTTSMIAYLLSQAGYEDELRIIHDSAVYLEGAMSYIESAESWTLSIEDFANNVNNSVNTSCVYGYSDSSTNITLPRYGQETNISLTPAYDETIDVVCTENIYADLTSSVRGTFLHYEGDNFTYTIPGPCWTFNNENVTCDVRATALALGTPIDSDRKNAARVWMESLLEEDYLGIHLPDEDMMNLAIYNTIAGDEFSSDEHALLLRHLLYRQANKGAWNTTTTYYNVTFYEPEQDEVANRSHVFADNISKSIVYTGFVIQTLVEEGYTSDDEPIADAERWVSLHEEAVSVELDDESAEDEEIVAEYDDNVSDIIEDPKRNAMALYVLEHHTRPFIKSSPSVITLDTSSVSIDIVNPTTFELSDLTYELDSDLRSHVAVEEKDYLQPYSFRRITLSQTSTNPAPAFGYLRINQGSDTFAKIPVILAAYPDLLVYFPHEMTVFGSAAIVPLNVTKSPHNFSCTLRWSTPGISALTSFSIEQTGAFNLPIQFTQTATEDQDYAGELECAAVSSTFKFPFSIAVSRFLTKPLSVTPSVLSTEALEEPLSLVLTNLLDESIDVTVTLRDDEERIDISDPYMTLYPGEKRNITLTVLATPEENVSIVNSVVISTFNIEERVPLQVEIIAESPVTRPLWLLVAVTVFVVGLLSLIGYFTYSNRRKLIAWYLKRFKRESTIKAVLARVEEYEEKEEAVAIKNMVQILKLEGLQDKEIRQRLIDIGYTDLEINDALKMKAEVAPARK